MKMYILRWNPKFSLPYEAHLEGMKMLVSNPLDSNWSIHDHEDLEEGDIFIFNQVGTGDEDGIAGFGTFTSSPYTAPNWRQKDGTNRFYADMDMQCLLDRRGGNIFSASEMEKLFPQIDWHTGHAGVLAPSEIVEPLVAHIVYSTLPLEQPAEKISFFPARKKYGLAPVFASFINGCCPNLKSKIISGNKIEYLNFKEGEAVDENLIEVSATKFAKVKLSLPTCEDELVKFFVPVA